MKIRRLERVSIFILTIGIMMSQSCKAFEVMVSLNTYKKSKVVNAVSRVNEFHADGVWFITKNSDFTDTEWRDMFEQLGGRQISEDNPGKTESYDRYVSMMGASPHESFFYNETGGEAGGTLLSDVQIDAHYAHIGNRPIICLTRAYVSGGWKTEVDRCIANHKVGAICIEPVRGAIMETSPGVHNGIPQLMDAVMAAGKKLFFLVHAAPDGWSDADQAVILSNLNRWNSAALGTDSIILVYQNYDQQGGNTTTEWLGSTESVKSAMVLAMAHSKYTGSGPVGNTSPPSVSFATPLKVVSSTHSSLIFIFATKNAANATLEAFTLDGKKVQTIFNGKLKAGQQKIEWNMKSENNAALSNGVYMCKLTAGNESVVKKVAAIK